MHAGCVFVSSIHPFRTWMSGYFKSVWWNACVWTDWTLVYTLLRRSFWGLESEPMLTLKGKIPSMGKILLRGGSNGRCCIKQDSELNTLSMSYSGPLTCYDFGAIYRCMWIHSRFHTEPLSNSLRLLITDIFKWPFLSERGKGGERGWWWWWW